MNFHEGGIQHIHERYVVRPGAQWIEIWDASAIGMKHPYWQASVRIHAQKPFPINGFGPESFIMAFTDDQDKLYWLYEGQRFVNYHLVRVSDLENYVGDTPF